MPKETPNTPIHQNARKEPTQAQGQIAEAAMARTCMHRPRSGPHPEKSDFSKLRRPHPVNASRIPEKMLKRAMKFINEIKEPTSARMKRLPKQDPSSVAHTFPQPPCPSTGASAIDLVRQETYCRLANITSRA